MFRINKEPTVPVVREADKQVNTIYSTTDYSKFKYIPSNRKIVEYHVNKIRKSIEENNLLTVNPIVVDRKFNVIDGQHRLEAAKVLGVPISYVIGDNVTMQDAVSFNINSRGWKFDDFFHHYRREGYKPYIELSNFLKDYPQFPLREAARYGCTLCAKKKNLNPFTKGQFTFNNSGFLVELIEHIYEFKDLHKSHWRTRAFIGAVAYMMKHPRYNKKQMIDRMKLLKETLYPAPSQDIYVERLTDIFNYRRKGENRVKF